MGYPFRSTPFEYGGKEIFENLSFLIKADQIKHLYGECHVALYQDEKPTADKSNPYNRRVVITNADGWVICSDVLLDFPVEVFDGRFGFEPIVKDDATSVSSEEPKDDESVSNETECQQSVGSENKLSLRTERKSFCARGQRLKHLQRHKHFHPRHLSNKIIRHRKRAESVECMLRGRPDSIRTGDQ